MDSKLSARRRVVRRQAERRTNPYAFNSAEWIAMMREQYLLWPKFDRRTGDRRQCERRAMDRRASLRSAATEHAFRRVRLLSADDLLNDDEKQMIRELFADDD